MVQPIAGSTRKGGRNQGNALSTEPMPYSEAMSLNRAVSNASLAHRRAQKANFERYDHGGYYPSSITIPAYGYAGTMSTPFSAPAHFSSPPVFSTSGHHADANYIGDSRRPPFKHMSTAPGGMYTLHNNESGSAWQTNPSHYASVSSQDPYHPSGTTQDISGADPNPFWRLSTSLTSPQTTDVSLPPPRPSPQWIPNSGSNYTHERANANTTLPHHSALDMPVPTFQATSQQFFQSGVAPPANHAFQSPPATAHEEHCGDNTWPRTVPYRSGASV